MASLLDNCAYIQSKMLTQALERQYADYEQEKARLERKLPDIQRRIDQQESLGDLAQEVNNVLQ